jgi:hypothetical protein
MFTRISTALSAAMILGSVSIASAATIHHPVRHYYHHQHPVMLLENNPAAARTYWQNEAITEAAIRFQEQWDVGY